VVDKRRGDPESKVSPVKPERRPPIPVSRVAARKPRPSASANAHDSRPLQRGEWLFTTREGAETDLIDEIALSDKKGGARILGPGLVASPGAPSREGRIDLTFARQGFPVSAVLHEKSWQDLANAIAATLAQLLFDADVYVLHTWVPDTESQNPLSGAAHQVEEAVLARLAEVLPKATSRHARDLGPEAVAFAQVCLLGPFDAAVGVLSSNRAQSLAPGGRHRVHVPAEKPSRSARKLAEAFAWLGLGPEAGEVCVDLGASPGGWTWLLLERRARVIAVDLGKLRPDLMTRKGLTYVPGNAFEYVPPEPVDWLFCDMAFRPVEVARLLGKWAREHLATMLVANFKMPMKRKADAVLEIRTMLEEGGWKGVRTRQLYHDREEITVTARLM
jgi:23S rRNA (cytidine2498-2'-O)-methyltransferase